MADASLSAVLLARPLLSQALAGALGREKLLPPAPREVEQLLARPARQRTKLWEFGINLHCSIIGTCLSTGELRQVLGKIGRKEAVSATEHDVHASAVLLAGKHHDGGKLLHKALDRRHRVAISRFDRAKTAAEVRALWQEASSCGDIPGAYWAALTHPATHEAMVREIFAEVHMLSHLVGAANRADIRRLRQLEAEKEELETRLEFLQERMHDAIAARDQALRQVAARGETVPSPSAPLPSVAEDGLAAELKARLVRCESHSERIERELEDARTALSAEQAARTGAEARETALRRDLDIVEASLAPPPHGEADPNPLLGLTVLYVGGRPAQIGHLRDLAERAGAIFLYHDGGIEERDGLLPGLVSRADAVLFPVDCISHTAMLALKRLCRQTGKRFVPLRSAGLAPFYAALKDSALSTAEG